VFLRFSVDGACRHLVATLFEVIDFVQDSKKENVTSGYCKWVKRAKGNEDPILFTELETSYLDAVSKPFLALCQFSFSCCPLVPHSILLMSFMLYFNISPKLIIIENVHILFLVSWCQNQMPFLEQVLMGL
jgi:hypothetical protein